MPDVDVHIRLLGPVEIDDGADEPLSPRLRRLLTALALSPGTQVSEAALIDIVWGDSGDLPANPARSLQTYISRLRALLGAAAIERSSAGYRLVADRVWVDIAEFEERLDHARAARARADDRGAVADLEHALGLWAGDALSDFSGESWATGEARRLDELRLDAEEQRAELLVGLDDVDGALIADLERLAVENPHRDGPARQLMLALHRAGRQADALAAFSRHRHQLATDLGLEPSAELAQLESQILTDDPALENTSRTRPLRGYEIRERLGEGAFSIVYRGTQPSVEREVAIKQIRAELANRPEFIRRFETEAHLVARLEHPHIVPLYDYWREPDSAYLVMRLLTGGSLETALHSGPWDLDRTVEMLADVGSALAEAHRTGVVHRDVKPANILLDDIGNSYLTDFGIALEAHELADPGAALSSGSPAYASPEQLRHESASPAADIHGLGIVVYETLVGRLPFPDEPTQAALLRRQLHDPIPSLRESRPDLPAGLDSVLATATAKNPADRHASVGEFVDAVHAVIEGAVPEPVRHGVATAMSAGRRNPYKGLRAFDEADADDFTGRARLIDQFVERLSAGRFLAVVGPSGSGKSSAVRAGLLPALRAGAVSGSQDWFVTTMMPGPAPFEELETALLRVAPQRPVDLLRALKDGRRGIARGLRHAVPDDDAQVLLLIDQFEELFTLGEPADAAAFLDALATAVSEERPRVRVVVTLRADFYDRPLRHQAIGRLVRDSTVAVLPLAADELEHAIVDPAAAEGVMFEPGLVSQIVADVADQPGALPMLQYALTELYDRQVSGVLTQSSYRELGGVAGAVGRRAEELFAEATDDEQAAMRRVFGRLVSLGEGVEDTRRRAKRRELGDDAAVAGVVERFGAARLLSFDADPESREPTVEVAHEALLREWPRLRLWLDEDRDGLRVQRHIHTTATEWDERGRPSGELYRGGRLESAEEWAASHISELTAVEAEFVAASVQARDAEIEAAARTTQRLRRRLTGVAAVATLALIAGGIAFQQQRSASRNADRAEAAQADAVMAASEAEAAQAEEATARADAEANRQLAEERAFESETGRVSATAASLVATNSRAALLLAVAAHQRDPSPATLGGLQQSLLGAGRVVQRINRGTPYLDVDWVADGRVVATRIDGLDLIDLDSGTVVDSVPLVGAATAITDFARTATDESGSVLAVLTDLPDDQTDQPDLGSVSVYSIGDRLDLRFTTPLDALGLNVAVSPSGDLIVVTGATATQSVVRAWSPSGEEQWNPRIALPRPPSVLDQARPVLGDELTDPSGWSDLVGALVSVTADRVFVANGVLLHRFDHSGQELGGPVLTTTASRARPRFVSQVVETDGGWLTIDTLEEGAVAKVDRGDGWPAVLALESLGPLDIGSQTSMTAATPVGSELLTSRADGVLVAYDPATGQETDRIELEGGQPEALALSPGGERVAVAHSFGLSVAAVGDGGPLGVAIPRKPGHDFVTMTEDGSALALSGFGDPAAPTPELWRIGRDGPRPDPATGVLESSRLSAIFNHPNRITTSPDPLGPHEVTYSLDTFEVVSDWPTNPLGTITLLPTQTPLGVIRAQAGFPPESQIVVFHDGQFDQPDWILPPPGETGAQVWGLAADPARPRLLVADTAGDANVWDLESRTTVLDDFLAGQEIAVGGWSDDGALVATAAPDGTLTIRDGESFEVITTMASLGRISNLAGFRFSPDRSILVSSIFGGVTQLWDVETGTRIGVEIPSMTIAWPSVADGRFQLVTATEGHAVIWNLDVDSWPDIACRAAGSNLTAEEWATWGPRDTEPYAVCSDFPLPG